MQKLKPWIFLLVSTLMLATLASCKKNSDGDNNNGPVVTIADTSQKVSEAIGTASITINLSKAPAQAVQLNYELSGTAILNGDYEVATTSPVTIAAGTTSATIQFAVYDDGIVESDKTIHIKLSSSNLSFTDKEATITINDNDVSKAANGLQTDLDWNAGTLVNLDLYVVNNVVISNNTITDFDIVTGSEAKKGFESVLLNNAATDGAYYIVAYYESGTRALNYTLTFNSPAFTDLISEGSFKASDVGYGQFWGPITKNGSTYSRADGSIFSLKGLNTYPYYGKIKRR